MLAASFSSKSATLTALLTALLSSKTVALAALFTAFFIKTCRSDGISSSKRVPMSHCQRPSIIQKVFFVGQFVRRPSPPRKNISLTFQKNLVSSKNYPTFALLKRETLGSYNG